jgi:GAF domain-containing protein
VTFEFSNLLILLNETIATAIVVIAASLLLYNLTRNLGDRVARTSAIVLGCMTAAYLSDVFLSLGPGLNTYQAVLRLQWIGIAFMPVALLHLSDALLATTGLPSRGRRRTIIRLLYLLSALFLLLAAFTDWLIAPVSVPTPPGRVGPAFASIVAGPLFAVYAAYFVVTAVFAFVNVQRARLRCITRATRRRMGYLQFALLTPAVGIFPFSILLGPGQEYSPSGVLLVIAANIGVILMLLFLAYPLSFFGSRTPDRLVKTELLRFLLRGPATGLLALVAILYIAPLGTLFGLPEDRFTPFAVIAIVLVWQWFIAVALPYLERGFIYASEDDQQLETLEALSDRLLSRTDLIQLQEAILHAVCDYLRVTTAFIAAFQPARSGENGSRALALTAAVGLVRPTGEALEHAEDLFERLFEPSAGNGARLPQIIVWQGYWLTPLFSEKSRSGQQGPETWIGVLGVQARAAHIDFTADDADMLAGFAARAATSIEDLTLQQEIFSALGGLLPQIRLTRENTGAIEYRPARPATPAPAAAPAAAAPAPDLTALREQVKAALRHYWGGPGLTSSRLLTLKTAQQLAPAHNGDAARTMRALLDRALDRMKPIDGEKSMTAPEWTLYNILHLRFVKGVTAKEVAHRLSLSEAHLYRRQNAAIDAMVDQLLALEREASDRAALDSAQT